VHRHIVSGLKNRIESTLRLPLGDALNLALFLLSVFSLVLAGAGVWIAEKTLRDARQSGEQQNQALQQQTAALRETVEAAKSQQTTLESSRDSLLRAKDSLATLQTEILSQQKLLEQEVGTSREELETIRELNERAKEEASRRPRVKVALQCWGMEWTDIKTAEAGGSSPDRPEAYMRGRDQLGRDVQDGEKWCAVFVDNIGNADLIDPSFQWSSTAQDVPNHDTAVRIQLPGQPVPPTSVLSVDIADGKKIYPHAVMKSAKIYEMYLLFPEEVKTFTLSFHLVGENLPDTVGWITIHILSEGEKAPETVHKSQASKPD
jgi:hypothetical protein